jgi:hypothetical protein
MADFSARIAIDGDPKHRNHQSRRCHFGNEAREARVHEGIPTAIKETDWGLR